jgi:HK97 gp10 family phage protein
MSQTPAQFATKLRRDYVALKRKIMTRVVVAVRDAARNEAPLASGALRKAFTTRVERAGDRGVVANTASYAGYVHYGTRPHIILPKRPSGVLRFTVGGKVRFAKVVRHPGTRANPFFMRALAASQDSIRTILQEEAHLFIRSLV